MLPGCPSSHHLLRCALPCCAVLCCVVLYRLCSWNCDGALSPTVGNIGMTAQVVLTAQCGIMYDRLSHDNNLPNTATAQRVLTSGQKTLFQAVCFKLHLNDGLTTCSPICQRFMVRADPVPGHSCTVLLRETAQGCILICRPSRTSAHLQYYLVSCNFLPKLTF